MTLRLAVLSASALVSLVPSFAQVDVCHDWDGDDSLAGIECISAGDCADDSWRRHPGASEVCDGLDSDCDGLLDEGCDRYCDQPVLTQSLKSLTWNPDLPETLNGRVALLDDGFIACATNYLYNPGTENQQSKVSLRRFDRAGQPRGLVERVGWPLQDNSDESDCRIAASSDRVLVTWRQFFPGPDLNYKFFARQTDSFGRALGPIVEISGAFGVSSSAEAIPIWNGEEFGVIWVDAHQEILHLTRIPRWPSPGGPLDVLITDDVLGQARTVQALAATWTGDAYLLAFGAIHGFEKSMMTMRVERDGTPYNLGQEIAGYDAGNVAVTYGDSKALMIWTDHVTRPFDTRVWYQFVDPLTGQFAPSTPRELKASRNFGTSSNLYPLLITWTGEMFSPAVTEFYWTGQGYDYEHWMWRVLPSGTNLDPQAIHLSGAGPRADMFELVWNGKELWSFHAMKSPREFRRARIACNCGDLDGDGRNACIDDCDDSNFQVAPTRPEVCTGGLDDDCDGFIDCADSNCPAGPGPVEVTGLRWTAATLTWNSTPTATRYAVARGLLSDLIRRADMINAECVAFENPTTSWLDDGRKPPKGDVLWYLIRAEAGPCRYGTWGAEALRTTIQICD